MTDRANVRIRSRPALVVGLAVTIALGLASRKFGSSLPTFIADNAGDALWTVAAFFGLAIAFPSWPSLKLGTYALGISFAVELSQLIDAEWLNGLRRNQIARLFLGRGFVWLDFVRYLAGAAVAIAIDRLIRFRRSPSQAT